MLLDIRIQFSALVQDWRIFENEHIIKVPSLLKESSINNERVFQLLPLGYRVPLTITLCNFTITQVKVSFPKGKGEGREE